MSFLGGSLQRDEHGRPIGWGSREEESPLTGLLKPIIDEVGGNISNAYGEFQEWMQDPAGNIVDSLTNWPPANINEMMEYGATEDDFMNAMDTVHPAGLLAGVVRTMKMASKNALQNPDLRRAVKFHENHNKEMINPASGKKIDLGNLTSSDEIQLKNYGQSLKKPAVRKRESARLNSNREIVTSGEYIRPTGRIMKPQDLKDRVLVNLNADITGKGQVIKSVSGIPLTKPVTGEGGVGYTEAYKRWASMREAAAKKQAHADAAARMTGKDPLYVYTPMTETGGAFSTMPMDVAMQQLEYLNPPNSAILQFDRNVRRLSGRDDFVGLNSQAAYDQLMGQGEFPMKGAGALRKVFMEVLGQPGTMATGMPRADDAFRAVNDPTLVGLPRESSGLLYMEPTVGGRLYGDNPRHSAYDTEFEAEVAGITPHTYPSSMLFGDAVNAKGNVLNWDSAGPRRALEVGQYFKEVDQKLIEDMLRWEEENPTGLLW